MKVAVITGASTGIGKYTAIEMAKSGYHVHLVARSAKKLSEVKNIIERDGGVATVATCDLSSMESVNDLIKKLNSEAKHIHAIINIAGIWHGSDEVFAGKNFEDFDQKTILQTYAVGFTAPTLLIHGLIQNMPENSAIVNLSGTFEDGGRGWVPYFASKRALEDLTLGLADDLIRKKIKVNCVSPSDTATDEYRKYFPEYIDEAIDPQLIAEKIVELCDEKNWVTGKIIVLKKDVEPFEKFHA